MIEPQFLNDVAEYVDSRIYKVVLNGAFEITEFTVKEVTENVVALNYVVPANEISSLNLIEVKDSSDNLITSEEVNVPITTDTLLSQSIEVKEVTS